MGTELRAEPTAVYDITERPDTGVPACVDGAKHRISNRWFGRDHDPSRASWCRCIGRRPLYSSCRQEIFEDAPDFDPNAEGIADLRGMKIVALPACAKAILCAAASISLSGIPTLIARKALK